MTRVSMVALLALASLTAPLVAEAQQAGKVARVGVLRARERPTQREGLRKGFESSVTPRDRTSSSRYARQRGDSNGFPASRRSWCVSRWT